MEKLSMWDIKNAEDEVKKIKNQLQKELLDAVKEEIKTVTDPEKIIHYMQLLQERTLEIERF